MSNAIRPGELLLAPHKLPPTAQAKNLRVTLTLSLSHLSPNPSEILSVQLQNVPGIHPLLPATTLAWPPSHLSWTITRVPRGVPCSQTYLTLLLTH